MDTSAHAFGSSSALTSAGARRLTRVGPIAYSRRVWTVIPRVVRAQLRAPALPASLPRRRRGIDGPGARLIQIQWWLPFACRHRPLHFGQQKNTRAPAEKRRRYLLATSNGGHAVGAEFAPMARRSLVKRKNAARLSRPRFNMKRMKHLAARPRQLRRLSHSRRRHGPQ